MSNLPRIEDRAEYARFDSDGLEQCPVCGTSLDPRWNTDPVYQPTGPGEATEYDHLLETDPMDGPFYCAGCWRSHEVRVKQAANQQLTDFASQERVYYGE